MYANKHTYKGITQVFNSENCFCIANYTHSKFVSTWEKTNLSN